MTETLPEPQTPLDVLMDALVTFMGQVGGALDICSYGLTVGETYVPFDPDADEDCEDSFCEQAWTRVAGVAVLASEGFGGDQDAVLRYTLEVGVLRCMTVEEDGEAPTATDVLAASIQAMDDMTKIHCAALDDESPFTYVTMGQWTPVGPLGGQVGGTWTLQVEV